jgi:hypothetical protein
LRKPWDFEKRRLDCGGVIVAPADDQVLAPTDFELKTSTHWSAGAIGCGAASSGSEIETVLAQTDQDFDLLKKKF